MHLSQVRYVKVIEAMAVMTWTVKKSNPSILDPNITMKEMAFVSPAPANELSETSESDRSHGCDDVDSEKK